MTLWVLFFCCFLGLFGSVVAIWWRVAGARRRQQMASAIRGGLTPPQGTARPAVLVEPPGLKPRGPGRFLRFGAQDDAGPGTAKLGVITVALALAGVLLGTRFTRLIGPAAPWLCGIGFAATPYLLQRRKKAKRLAVLEEQFPEALDCLARSVRAGNAFSVAIDLLSDEINDPLKGEFQKVSRELSLGARLEDAFDGLMARVPLLEVRFFAAAVLLQRETGGNLSEVIANLAESLRERFKLRGHVKAASGQGRITAAVLSVLPVATVALLTVVSPDYIHNLTEDPLGRDLLAGAVVFQVIGYLVMQRITHIEV
jgi:tight adherence protein B